MGQIKRKAIEEVLSSESNANQTTLQSKHSNKTIKSIPLAVIHFDELPDSGYVRLPIVLLLFGCSKASWWRWVKILRVPSPVRFGSRFSAWQVGELRACLERMQSSDQVDSAKGGCK